MEALMRELFTTDIGLLSLFTIAFIIVMGAYIHRFVKQKIQNDARAAERAQTHARTHTHGNI